MHKYRIFFLIFILFYVCPTTAEWNDDLASGIPAADMPDTQAGETPIEEIPMIAVPGGCFETGSQFSSYADGKLGQLVCVNHFEIGQFEVTQGLWQSVMDNNPSFFSSCGPECPVERVSWNQVQTFIAKLNRITSMNYRLPTEAEWEYACRSDVNLQRYCGGDSVFEVGWFADNSSGKTHPVGLKKANSLGIYDLSGNVWEWVQDRYGENYPNPDLDRQLQSNFWDDSYRILRGGSWRFDARSLEAADRGFGSSPDDRTYDMGFRLARTR